MFFKLTFAALAAALAFSLPNIASAQSWGWGGADADAFAGGATGTNFFAADDSFTFADNFAAADVFVKDDKRPSANASAMLQQSTYGAGIAEELLVGEMYATGSTGSYANAGGWYPEMGETSTDAYGQVVGDAYGDDSAVVGGLMADSYQESMAKDGRRSGADAYAEQSAAGFVGSLAEGERSAEAGGSVVVSARASASTGFGFNFGQ